MSTNRSQNYYFEHGDITILVNDTLFKLHRDIVESHCEYFHDQSENGDVVATSDEHPKIVPADVCSSDTFDTICLFLYPRAIGVFPPVMTQELDKWESVLQATISLQMRGLREYVLANFQGEIRNSPTSAAKLLGLALKYDEAPASLKLKCLHALVFLRRAISAIEIASLGEATASRVIAIRDRIRILIATGLGYWTTIHRHYLCVGGSNCQNFIHEGVFNHLKDADPLQQFYQTDSNIFQIPEDHRICVNCGPIRNDLAGTMAKEELEAEINRCAVGLGLLTVEE